jgi:hypothetical protein
MTKWAPLARSGRRKSAPAIALVKMTAAPLDVVKELDGQYAVLTARHVQAACRLFAGSEIVLVIASERLPFYDVHALEANLPPGALLRLAHPEIEAADIALLVRSIFRVLAFPRPRAS